jgi:hypothetical protein
MAALYGGGGGSMMIVNRLVLDAVNVVNDGG